MFACCARSSGSTPQGLAKEYASLIASVGANIRAIGDVFKTRVSSQEWHRPIEYGQELGQIKSSIARAREIVVIAQKIKASTKALAPVPLWRIYGIEMLEACTKTTALAGFIINQATADPDQRFQGNAVTYVAGAALLFAVGISEFNKCFLRRRASHLEISNALDQITGETQVVTLETATSVANILEHRLLAERKLFDSDLSPAVVDDVVSGLLERLDQLPILEGTKIEINSVAQPALAASVSAAVGVTSGSSIDSTAQQSLARNTSFWKLARAAMYLHRGSRVIPPLDSSLESVGREESVFGGEGRSGDTPPRIIVNFGDD